MLLFDKVFGHLMVQTVLITSNGAWKLGGFGFSISTNQPPGDLANVPAFHYAVSISYYLDGKVCVVCITIFSFVFLVIASLFVVLLLIDNIILFLLEIN